MKKIITTLIILLSGLFVKAQTFEDSVRTVTDPLYIPMTSYTDFLPVYTFIPSTVSQLANDLNFVRAQDTLWSYFNKMNVETANLMYYPISGNPNKYLVGADTLELFHRLELLDFFKMNKSDTIPMNNRINLKLTKPVGGTTAHFINGMGGLSLMPINLSEFNNDMRYADSVKVNNKLALKFNIPSGLSTQFLNGQGNPTNFPIIKGVTSYMGITNASGVYSVTYPLTYSTVPNVTIEIVSSNPRDVAMLTSSTVNGFSITIQRRADVIGLLPTYSNLAGIGVNVKVLEN